MGVNHVIPDFIGRAIKNEFVLYGALNTRSFIYIDDAVEDLVNLISLPQANGVLNIGGDIETSMLQLAEKIVSIMTVSNVKISQEKAPPGSVERRIPDLEKLNNLLGPRSRVNLEEGLRRTLNWYIGNRESN
jgi:UDP-glucose 4-epimerase/UDP-glucuronate decarboxylase